MVDYIDGTDILDTEDGPEDAVRHVQALGWAGVVSLLVWIEALVAALSASATRVQAAIALLD